MRGATGLRRRVGLWERERKTCWGEGKRDLEERERRRDSLHVGNLPLFHESARLTDPCKASLSFFIFLFFFFNLQPHNQVRTHPAALADRADRRRMRTRPDLTPPLVSVPRCLPSDLLLLTHRTEQLLDLLIAPLDLDSYSLSRPRSPTRCQIGPVRPHSNQSLWSGSLSRISVWLPCQTPWLE